MKFEGTFKTVDNANKYKVEIGTGNTFEITDPTETGEVAERDDKVMFDVVPVTIKCDRSDLNKRIIISQAEVNLISNMDLTDYFFAVNNRDVPLRITEISDINNVKHVFYGFVDPLQFDQGYAHNYEQVSITATDPLGTLESLTIDKLAGVTVATEMSPYALMTAIFNKIGIFEINQTQINQEVLRCMQNTKLQCQIFFGDDKDDYKSLYDVLETICKYFNLYIAMKDDDGVVITCTINNTPSQVMFTSFKNIATDESTSISMDDVYTQVQLTCNIEPVEDLIESIMDKDSLYSDYDNEEHYMTEYFSEMDGDNTRSTWAYWGFYDALNKTQQQISEDPNSYPYVYRSENYCYVLRNDAWDFGEGFAGQQGPQGSQGFNPAYKSYVNVMGGDIDHNTGQVTKMGAAHQYDLLYWMLGADFNHIQGDPAYGPQGPARNYNPVCRAALIGFEKQKNINLKTTSDNSPQSGDLNTYLVISTNGQGDQETAALAGYQSLLEPMQITPLCKYTQLSSNILSPTDNKTTNYVVISGEILLNPLQALSGIKPWDTSRVKIGKTYKDTKDHWTGSDGWNWWFNNVGYTNAVGLNNNYMYYQQKWDKSTQVKGGLYGFLDNSAARELKYEYSGIGDTNDKISKMPILACQLKVGTGNGAKYCVEELWKGEVGINSFRWMTELDMIAEEERIYLDTGRVYNIHQCPMFTIGIDPEHDGYIIGKKYQLSANSKLFKLEKEGMAIPVNMSDMLTGPVEFSILGPFNAQFQNYIHIYESGWFWEFDHWFTNPISVLNHCQSIMLGDLKIELTSNNGGLNQLKTTKDNDLVYYSNTDPRYLEIDEEDINICTPLTTEECENWGIKIQTSNSYVYWTSGAPFRGFLSNGESIRPEYCLVDYLYKEYCSPSRILDTQVKSSAFTNGIYGNSLNTDMLTKYYNGLPIKIGSNRTFNGRIMSYEEDLKYKTIDVKFRQHKTIENVQI